jgi:hypothetical protein
MKQRLVQLLRYVVGYEIGSIGEGCSQWYYFLCIVMSIMLVWRNRPDIASAYTLILAIEFVIVFVYGYFDMVDNGIQAPIIYFGVLLAIRVILMIMDWKFTLVMSLLGFIGQLIAPDEQGQSFLIRYREDYSKGPLIQNTLWFGFYTYIVMIMPVDIVTKIIFVIGAMLIHPLIDLSQGACACYIDNILDSVIVIGDYFYGGPDQE